MTRELGWDGCLNVRDLGGLPLESGGETRHGVYVRSDNVRQLTESGWRALAEHGVTRIVDLRWPHELAEDEPADVEIEVVHVSLVDFEPEPRDDLGRYMRAEDPTGYWSSQYELMLDRHPANFAQALTAIADAGPGAVVFHCAAGKDRTGLVAALLLRLAGVAADDVAADYARTFDALGRGPRAWVNAAPDPQEWERRMFMQHTPPEAMSLTLAWLDERYGGAAGYLREAGLDDARIERVGARLRS